MKLKERIGHILYVERFVSEHTAEDELRNQQGIALIAAAAFAVMSLLNIKQHAVLMLASTAASSAALLLGYLLSRRQGNAFFLRGVFYTIFIVIFTAYTLLGGNEGFAVLWLIIATYAVMIAIDFRGGFLIGLYYLVMLLLVFAGPLSPLLRYPYSETFLLRFPFLYGINFAFAAYIVVRIRTYQYQLLLKQQELERLSTTDLSTGLLNRNSFIQYKREFQSGGVRTLLAVFIDVNGLHEINNRSGHDAGDRILSILSALCKAHFPGDTIFRMGGDEFLILCQNADEAAVSAAVQALADAAEREGCSISCGVERQEGDFDLEEIVKRADAKMIRSKCAHYAHAGGEARP